MTNTSKQPAASADLTDKATNTPPQTKAAKAKLLLNLIKSGAIPPPSADFLLELSQKVKSELIPEDSNFDGVLQSLSLHLAQVPLHVEAEPEQDISVEMAAPKADASVPKTPRDEYVPFKTGRTAGKSNVLADQHPAVIYREIGELSEDELKRRLKTLPGQTARQVAYLAWHRTENGNE